VTAAGARRAAFRAGARRGAVVAVALAVVLGFGVAIGAVLEDGDASSADGLNPAPGPVDIGFSQDMIVHHEQAVLMAQLVRTRTKDPKVAALAAGVEDSQLLDIGALRGYLTLWGAPTLPSGPPMAWMTEAHHAAAAMGGMTTMPGMATTQQINELRTATGVKLDRMFLTLLRAHHAGGIPMMEDAAAHAAIPTIRSLAARMAFDQQQEIQSIDALLATTRS
jgi:uncharacterized protein (DUF305 family)